MRPFSYFVLTFFIFSAFPAYAEPFKVGALLCQTGSCAEWGVAALKGAELAAEEINRAGGIKGERLELVAEDSAEDSLNASLSGYRSLRLKGVNVIIGPSWSAAGNAISPVAKKDQDVIMISPSLGVRDFNEAGPNLFNIWPHDEYGARRMAAYAQELGLTKVAIFGAEQPWSITQARVFKEEFERLGGSVVAEVVPTPDQRDLRVESTRIVSSGAEAVLFTCFAEQMGVAARQLAQLGFKGQKLSVLMYDSALSISHGALDGTHYAAYPEPSTEFQAKFFARYGEKPGTSADKGYDATWIVARALQRASSRSTQDVRQALLGTKDFSGASGSISFTPQRSVMRVPEIFSVESGRMGFSVASRSPSAQDADAMRAQLKRQP
jgi:branched-chain amino acid transport system substrate-binding protein